MLRLIFLLVILVLFFGASFFINVPKTSSDELSDITKQIQDLTNSLNESIKATTPLESQLNNLKKQIDGIKNKLSFIETDIVIKEKNINEGYKNLAKQELILNRAIRDFYIKSYYNSPIWIFFSSSSVTDITQVLAYQKAATNQDKAIITNIAITIQDLQTKKKSLENEKRQLSSLRLSLDEQSAKLDEVVSGAKKYQAGLSSRIAELSAKQQQILGQRLASLNIPRSAGTSVRGCTDDRGVDPGFSPRIAFFTYGAPHRNGMNQYGAWGRAKEQQGEEQILQAYYPNMTVKKDYDQGIQISTTTGWSGSIEEYVKRIYEVPDSWTDNNSAVLKAQAVAARTYALRSTSNGANTICTTEACQVFKPEAKGGNWDAAVEATKGWVLMDGGGPGFTQYASTHGGYILNIGKFDGRSGNPGSFAELNERAYDKESPWFYCDWGSRPEYNKTAWLKSEEVADIVNTLLLVKKDSSTAENLYQTDKPNPAGKETWSAEKVRSELGGSAITSVNDISVSADFGSGRTTTVTVNGISFSGSEFKDRFNLRAPANLQIVGQLFNVERK